MENTDDGDQGSNEPPRITPKHSLSGGEEGGADNDTPQATLVQLARVVNRPVTPPQQTSAPVSTAVSQRRSVRKTPGAGRLAPLPANRTARSPHVLRAFEQRRAVTPGRERRRSGRYQTARETPRDLLRALSRQLAPMSTRYQETPPEPSPRPPHLSSPHSNYRASDAMFYSDPRDNSDDEDEELPPAPRLSMDLNEFEIAEDEEDGRIPVPRYSLPLDDLDDMEYTHTSVEFGRRAVTERPYRPSFGIRLSDRFADFNAPGAWSSPRTTGFEVESDRVDGEEELDEIALVGDESFASRMSLVNDGDVTGDFTGAMDTNIDLDGDEPSFFLPVPGENSYAQANGSAPRTNGVPLNGHAYGEEDQDKHAHANDRAQRVNGVFLNGDARHEYGARKEVAAVPKSSKPARKPVSTVRKKKKPLPRSQHGIPYQPFPRQVIKKMAAKFSGSTISPDTLEALVAASEAFFQQASEDLGAYAKHAGRKVVEDSDVVQLLRRQRQTNLQTTAFSLAQCHLPRELLQEIRLPVSKVSSRRQQRPSLQTIQEDEMEDEGVEDAEMEQ